MDFALEKLNILIHNFFPYYWFAAKWILFIGLPLYLVYTFVKPTEDEKSNGLISRLTNNVISFPAVYFTVVISIFPLIILSIIVVDLVGGVGDLVKDTTVKHKVETDWGDIPVGNPEEDSNTHHVDPHWVDGYERSDGTDVDGYWRGGDDGYDRGNPDGFQDNNINP